MDVPPDPTTNTSRLLVDPRHAAAMLSVSPRTLASLTARGEVQSIKIGKSRRYPVDGLRAFVAARLEGGVR